MIGYGAEKGFETDGCTVCSGGGTVVDWAGDDDNGGVKATGVLSVVRVTISALSIVLEVRGILDFGFPTAASCRRALIENNVPAIVVTAMMVSRTHVILSRFQ